MYRYSTLAAHSRKDAKIFVQHRPATPLMTVIPVWPRLIVSVLTVLRCLPSFAPPLADATSSPPSTFLPVRLCSWPHFCFSGNVFAVDATVPVVFLSRFRLFGEWAAWGGGLGSPHICRTKYPSHFNTLHNVTFHVCCTRGVPTSGQASSWLASGVLRSWILCRFLIFGFLLALILDFFLNFE